MAGRPPAAGSRCRRLRSRCARRVPERGRTPARRDPTRRGKPRNHRLRPSCRPPASEAYGFKLKYGGEVTTRCTDSLGITARFPRVAKYHLMVSAIIGCWPGTPTEDFVALRSASRAPRSLSVTGRGGSSGSGQLWLISSPSRGDAESRHSGPQGSGLAEAANNVRYHDSSSVATCRDATGRERRSCY